MNDMHDLVGATNAPSKEYMAWQGRPAATVDLVLGDHSTVERYTRRQFSEALDRAREDGWGLLRAIDAAGEVSTLFFERVSAEG